MLEEWDEESGVDWRERGERAEEVDEEAEEAEEAVEEVETSEEEEVNLCETGELSDFMSESDEREADSDNSTESAITAQLNTTLVKQRGEAQHKQRWRGGKRRGQRARSGGADGVEEWRSGEREGV